jgi:hypothetical protein
MEVERSASLSDMYQVPLDKASVRVFKNPENQTEESMNCAGVSAQLLGMITYTESVLEVELSKDNGRYIDEIVKFTNDLHGEISEFHQGTSDTILDVLKKLFPRFATIVLVSRPPPDEFGHFFVLFKDADGTPYILDPQIRKSFAGVQAINKYLEDSRLTATIYYIKSPPRYADGYIELYREHILSDLFMKQCKIGGRRRSRKNGKKTKKSRKHHGVRTRRRRH